MKAQLPKDENEIAREVLNQTNADVKVDAKEKSNPFIYKLKRPFTFEDEEITEIDLTGLENLNALSLRKIDHSYRVMPHPPNDIKEYVSAYLQLVISHVTRHPIELINKIGPKDITFLEYKVRNFLLL